MNYEKIIADIIQLAVGLLIRRNVKQEDIDKLDEIKGRLKKLKEHEEELANG